jgi:hypothetical protein
MVPAAGFNAQQPPGKFSGVFCGEAINQVALYFGR